VKCNLSVLMRSVKNRTLVKIFAPKRTVVGGEWRYCIMGNPLVLLA
jgi:hypothetical protein